MHSPAFPTVSVFVPSYNYGRFLSECVGSVLSQEGANVKVLIIDDASTDETPRVAEELRRQDSRVDYIRHARNQGHIATYNEGIDWADGDYTVLLSADDLLTPGSLRRSTQILEAHPTATFAYGRGVPFRPGQKRPKPRVESRGGRFHVWSGDRWIDAICRRARNDIASPEVVVRTAAQKRAGGYRPELPRAGDLEMWLRLASLGSVGRVVDSDQAYYRLHDNAMHNSRMTTAVEYTAQRKAAFDRFFDDSSSHDAQLAARRRTTTYEALSRKMLRVLIRALDQGKRDLDGSTPNEVIDFCATLCDVESLPECRALKWRVSLGTRGCLMVGPLVATATLRHPRAWVTERRGLRVPATSL